MEVAPVPLMNCVSPIPMWCSVDCRACPLNLGFLQRKSRHGERRGEEINPRQPGADAQTPHGGDLTSTSDTFTTRDSIGPRINEGARWLGELREDDANRTM